LARKGGEERHELRSGLSPGAFHRLSLEIDGPRVRLTVDDLPLWSGRLASLSSTPEIALLTRGGRAAFSGFSTTLGWEDLFYPEAGDPAELGWEVLAGTWGRTGRSLLGKALGEAGEEEATIAKGPLLSDYELVVNLRLLPGAAADGGWGIHPARTAEG